jgi:hypothetical protein
VLLLLDAADFAQVIDSIIWLDEPLLEPVAGGERQLILTAAPEHALLSMGGYLLNRRGRLDCLNAVCFSPTSSLRSAPALVTFNEELLARRDDANLWASAAGFRNSYFDLPAHSVRELTSTGEDRLASEKSVRSILNALIYRLIERHRPTHVFAPAAIGQNPDVRLLFEAALQIFENGYFPETSFHIYEPLPEAAAYIEVDSFLSSFENEYVRARGWFDDVTEVTPRKRHLMSLIRTQQTSDELVPLMNRIAARNSILSHRSDDASAERFWALELTFGSD